MERISDWSVEIEAGYSVELVKVFFDKLGIKPAHEDTLCGSYKKFTYRHDGVDELFTACMDDKRRTFKLPLYACQYYLLFFIYESL